MASVVGLPGAGPAPVGALSCALEGFADDSNKQAVCEAYFIASANCVVGCGAFDTSMVEGVCGVLRSVTEDVRARLLVAFFEACASSARLTAARASAVAGCLTDGASDVTACSSTVPSTVSVGSSVSSGRAAKRARARERARAASLRGAPGDVSARDLKMSVAQQAHVRGKEVRLGIIDRDYCYVRAVVDRHVWLTKSVFGPRPEFLRVAAAPVGWFEPFPVLATMCVDVKGQGAHVSVLGSGDGNTRMLTLFRSVRCPVPGSVAEAAVRAYGRADADFVNAEGFWIGGQGESSVSGEGRPSTTPATSPYVVVSPTWMLRDASGLRPVPHSVYDVLRMPAEELKGDGELGKLGVECVQGKVQLVLGEHGIPWTRVAYTLARQDLPYLKGSYGLRLRSLTGLQRTSVHRWNMAMEFSGAHSGASRPGYEVTDVPAGSYSDVAYDFTAADGVLRAYLFPDKVGPVAYAKAADVTWYSISRGGTRSCSAASAFSRCSADECEPMAVRVGPSGRVLAAWIGDMRP